MSYREQYDQHINSPEWAARKDQYYAGHARRCRACGSVKKIHLHHKTYVRFKYELDSDLVPLCEGCHDKVHALHKVQGGCLTKATDTVIAQIKADKKNPAGRRPTPEERRSVRRRLKKKKPQQRKVRPPKTVVMEYQRAGNRVVVRDTSTGVCSVVWAADFERLLSVEHRFWRECEISASPSPLPVVNG